MKPVHAIYEHGIFRPTEAVELPDYCEVEFVPRVVANNPVNVQDSQPTPDDRKFSHLDPKLAKIYAVLSRRHESGEKDVAERHNEHQP